MSEVIDAPSSEAPVDVDKEPLPGGLPPDDPKGEGTTPEEVAQVLKSSGMNLPTTDEEEGDSPDKEDDKPSEDKPQDDEDAEAEEVEEAEDEAKKPPQRGTPPSQETTDEDKYSFQVEDANGTTYKITADANLENVLEDFEPKNNGQIISILDQLRGVKELKAADEAQAADDSAKAERQARADELLKSWGDEATALQTDKRIPEGKDGQARIDQVYKFMSKENTARIKANRPTLNSFEDALDKLENQEARDKVVADAKADKTQARKNGALVGGSSAPATSSATPVYKGGAKNANQALRSMGLLS